MQVNSNLLSDILKYYKLKLESAFNEQESISLLYKLFDDFFGYSKIDMVKNSEIRLSESELLKVHFAVKDLLESKPIQYITGKVEFLDFKLSIEEGVLIPRPETEELVQLIIEGVKVNSGLRVLDIGSGSGCIPIALKSCMKSSEVIGIDVSKIAIQLARKNALTNKLDVDFRKIDVFKDDQVLSLGKFDILVSNPPYVRNLEKSMMQANVLNYEPELALFVDDQDPLIYYKQIAQLGKKLLNEGGKLYFEINEALGDEMIALMNSYGYQKVQLIKDFNNKDRFIKALH